MTGPETGVEPIAITDDLMNPMLFRLMKLAALIAVVVLSAGMAQASTCKCEHCPSKVSSTLASADYAPDCCCGTDSSTPGQSCPCGCQQAPTDQGLEPQSEVLSLDLGSARVLVARWTGNSPSCSAVRATPVALSDASLCVVLCRFRL